jgi:hypothetical protein
LEFTEIHDFDEAHVGLLIMFGRKPDAAEFLLSKGRTLEAHEILAQDIKNELSMRRVTKYILSGLWEHLSLGLVPVRRTKRVIDDLLRLAALQEGAPTLDSNDRNEVRTAKLLLLTDINHLAPDINVPSYCIHGPITTPANRPKVLL